MKENSLGDITYFDNKFMSLRLKLQCHKKSLKNHTCRCMYTYLYIQKHCKYFILYEHILGRKIETKMDRNASCGR